MNSVEPQTQLSALCGTGDGPQTSHIDAVKQRAELRAQEARERAMELQGRYRDLLSQANVSEQELQHARRAAIAARSNAAEANQHLLEQLDRSAAIHQLAAQAHDQAAAAARGHADRVGHTHAAERHRAAARRDRNVAVELRDGISALPG